MSEQGKSISESVGTCTGGSVIILSPGPGRPEDAGVIVDAVKTAGRDIPILGVCLGHQAICAAFGAVVTYAKELMQIRYRMEKGCLKIL